MKFNKRLNSLPFCFVTFTYSAPLMKFYRHRTFVPSYYFGFPILHRKTAKFFAFILSSFPKIFAVNEIKQMARYFTLCMLITDYYNCQIVSLVYNCEIYTCQCAGEKHIPSLRLPDYTFHQFVINNKRAFVFFTKTITLMLWKKEVQQNVLYIFAWSLSWRPHKEVVSKAKRTTTPLRYA